MFAQFEMAALLLIFSGTLSPQPWHEGSCWRAHPWAMQHRFFYAGLRPTLNIPTCTPASHSWLCHGTSCLAHLCRWVQAAACSRFFYSITLARFRGNHGSREAAGACAHKSSRIAPVGNTAQNLPCMFAISFAYLRRR